jgi:hypothetical protein
MAETLLDCYESEINAGRQGLAGRLSQKLRFGKLDTA